MAREGAVTVFAEWGCIVVGGKRGKGRSSRIKRGKVEGRKGDEGGGGGKGAGGGGRRSVVIPR